MDQDARAFFQAVEEHFITKRGRALLLSPADVHRVAEWHGEGVPLEAVLEAIDVHFERMARRGKEPRKAVTLSWLEDDVMDAWTGVKARRMGKNDNATAGGTSEASLGGQEDFARMSGQLTQAGKALEGQGELQDAVAKKIAAAVAKLNKKASLFDAGSADHDLQKAEDHLRRLEKKLQADLREALGEEALTAMQQSIETELEAKRERMKDKTWARICTQLLDKRLREKFGLPRLSLFYT